MMNAAAVRPILRPTISPVSRSLMGLDPRLDWSAAWDEWPEECWGSARGTRGAASIAVAVTRWERIAAIMIAEPCRWRGVCSSVECSMWSC